MNRERFVFRLALAMTLATYALIVLGGVVFNTGSSLACPDWPRCFGEWMPKMVGGVLYEHSHRLLAAFIGLCSILLAVMLWKPRPGAPSLRGPAAALPLLVIFQGVLGGLVVIYKLPMLVRAGHLAVSMIVLLTLVYLCRATWARAQGLGVPPSGGAWPAGVSSAFPLLTMLAILVYAQMIVGALVRHTNSSEAAGWGLANALIGRDPLTGEYSLWPAGGPAQLNVFHRYLALIVAGFVTLGCARVWTLARERLDGRGHLLAWLPVALVMAQIVVGIVMLATWNLKIYPELGLSDLGATRVQVVMRTLHLALGTALLASLGWLAVIAGEAARVREVEYRPNLQPVAAPH